MNGTWNARVDVGDGNNQDRAGCFFNVPIDSMVVGEAGVVTALLLPPLPSQ